MGRARIDFEGICDPPGRVLVVLGTLGRLLAALPWKPPFLNPGTVCFRFCVALTRKAAALARHRFAESPLSGGRSIMLTHAAVLGVACRRCVGSSVARHWFAVSTLTALHPRFGSLGSWISQSQLQELSSFLYM